MSFDWNLSSDEENGFDDWANVDLQESLKPARKPAGQAAEEDDDDSSEDEAAGYNKGFAGVAFGPSTTVEEEDEEDVNWEDAEEDSEGVEGETYAETAKLPADTAALTSNSHNLKPVTLDLKERPQRKKKAKQKRGARRSYRFEHLPSDLQIFLTNLEKAHMLSLTSHAIFASKNCSGGEALHLAHSLIPLAWSKSSNSNPVTDVPSEQDLSNFCHFFFNLVNRTVSSRRGQRSQFDRMPHRGRRKGKRKKEDADDAQLKLSTIHYRLEEYCAYLSSSPNHEQQQTNDSNVQGFNAYDRVQLFIAMVRSLGWRARYVTTLEPPKRDLDVSHPLFVAMSATNVFQRVWREKAKRGGDIKKRLAKRTKTNGDEPKASMDNTPASLPPALVDTSSVARQICWVEILCHCSTSQHGGRRPTKEKTPKEKPKMHWTHVDPALELVNQPEMVEAVLYSERQGIPFKNVKKKLRIPYALAAEHIDVSSYQKLRLTDVTPRYASSWVESLKTRGVIRGKQTKVKESDRVDMWWSATLKALSSGDKMKQEALKSKGKRSTDAIVLDDAGSDDDKKPKANSHIEEVDDHEREQLQASRKDEPIPTSKAAFKSHPIYAIPSVLNANEVLVPDAKKRVCGVCKGELVFRRTDVETAFSAKRWLYKSRQVKKSELGKPIKRVKARKKPVSASFKALKSYGVGARNDGSEEARRKQVEAATRPLDDGKEDVYASWQTDSWSPAPVGPGDRIPMNAFRNIELELLNSGLVHIDEQNIAKVAKQLGIPYAPCLLGFEGRGGNRTPTIRGIAVHEHNAELLREAHVEMASQLIEQSLESHQLAVYGRWKRLLVGVLTKDRLERAYGDSKETS